jgi:hypothetical protein
MYSGNRQSPSFEFVGSRLFLDPNNLTMPTAAGPANPGIPGYYDSLTSSAPGSASGTLNYYVYFSSYGNGAYDPNDVNFLNEADSNLASPIWLQFFSTNSPAFRMSAAPNPYSTTLTAPNPGVVWTNVVTYEKPQTFQIFSPGADGLYGVGGQYVPSSAGQASSSTSLPFDKYNTYILPPATAPADATIRTRERDNLTNFQSGTLQ